MKKLILSTALCLVASMASATEQCKKQGGGYVCPGNVYVDGSKAESAAAAAAVALAQQQQQQGQVQGQIAEGGNAYNAGNTVEISNPKHTTSMNLGVGVNFDIPIAQGHQTANAINTANWYIANGDTCTAFKVMDDSPRMRRYGIKRTCGDKG